MSRTNEDYKSVLVVDPMVRQIRETVIANTLLYHNRSETSSSE